MTEENHDTLQTKQSVTRVRFEPDNSWIQIRNVNVTLNHFSTIITQYLITNASIQWIKMESIMHYKCKTFLLLDHGGKNVTRKTLQLWTEYVWSNCWVCFSTHKLACLDFLELASWQKTNNPTTDKMLVTLSEGMTRIFKTYVKP